MKRTRTLLVALMAWMLCFQAVASVSDVRCKHAGQTASKQHMMNGHLMTMAAMGADSHSMHTGHDADMTSESMPGRHRTTAKNASAASICGCGSGCVCSGQCTVSCSGMAGSSPVVFVFSQILPVVSPEPVAFVAAHGLDLFRPPSIS